MLCGHTAADINAPSAQDRLFDGLDLGRLRAVMQRATYSAGEECEAELLATLIEKHTCTPASYNPTPLADRLAASLEGHTARANPGRGGRS